jgi:hypothetical protein
MKCLGGGVARGCFTRARVARYAKLQYCGATFRALVETGGPLVALWWILKEPLYREG